MAISKNKKQETKEKEVFKVEVLKAIQCKNDSIMVNLKVNGVYINGAFYKTIVPKSGEHKGEEVEIIQFPQTSRKVDGETKYFNVCSFFIDDETMEEIEKQIEEKLD